ncbi:MAG: hypothetical protein PHN49_03025 [Candidatus Omnitrophica bacterium]|nr:hypothetical protein [Candidatus Omnitrophota bacterium]MDD5670593.1 hypothetical protein [Candidatus Omnitrophota bacterium]
MINIGKIYSELSQVGKILLFVAVGIVFLFFMDQLVLGPILTRMKIMDAEIEAKKETIRRNMRILSFKESILKEYASYNEYLDSGEKTQEEIVGALLRKIETLAKQQNISIINIRPGDVIENPVFQEYRTSLECEGTLTDLLTFMNLLEESDYLFQITRYKMSPKSKGAEVIKCEMDIARILITAEEVLT